MLISRQLNNFSDGPLGCIISDELLLKFRLFFKKSTKVQSLKISLKAIVFKILLLIDFLQSLPFVGMATACPLFKEGVNDFFAFIGKYY